LALCGTVLKLGTPSCKSIS